MRANSVTDRLAEKLKPESLFRTDGQDAAALVSLVDVSAGRIALGNLSIHETSPEEVARIVATYLGALAMAAGIKPIEGAAVPVQRVQLDRGPDDASCRLRLEWGDVALTFALPVAALRLPPLHTEA